jgi:hypothetical protein
MLLGRSSVGSQLPNLQSPESGDVRQRRNFPAKTQPERSIRISVKVGLAPLEEGNKTKPSALSSVVAFE